MDRVRVKALIPASPAEVWALITEPANLSRWYSFGGAEVDARPGGRIVLRWPEHGDFPGVVDRVEPGRLFAFRMLPDPGPRVEITLTAADGGTTVVVTEEGELEDAGVTELSWRNGLGLLAGLAEG
ncbi:SRPBCC domain-containing protein [Phytomonospora sp. NPDC050363]|uniref:SRPBCC family protein n=1 Tax=Phytomonospora sp. NPDC050363 TaxID=3155642 RepID=UPI0034037EFF